MGTLRALTSGGGVQRRTEQTARLRGLFEACCVANGFFLLPTNYPTCPHSYVSLDSGYCVCSICGLEHFCGCGTCPEIVTRTGERICQITGCVTLENELRAERDAHGRTGPSPEGRKRNRRLDEDDHNNSAKERAGKKKKGHPLLPRLVKGTTSRTSSSDGGARSTDSIPSPTVSDLLRRGGGEQLRELVESTVREILASDKTERCLELERKRNETKEISVFSRGLREVCRLLFFVRTRVFFC